MPANQYPLIFISGIAVANEQLIVQFGNLTNMGKFTRIFMASHRKEPPLDMKKPAKGFDN